MSEESQLHQINGGLAVSPRSLAEVLDGPHNREEHGAAANNIYKQEHLLPRDPVMSIRATLINNNLSDVGNDLKRNNNHEDLLLLILKERLEEGPASANQDNQSEERNPLQEAEDVKQHIPAVCAPGALDVRLILGLTQQIQSLQDHNSQHKVVDSESGQALPVENGDPESSEGEIEKGEEEINPREDSPASGEIIASAGLAVEVVHGGSDVHGDLELLRVAVGEDEVVLVGVGLGVEGVEGVLAVEGVEGVDGLDEIGLEGAADLAVLKLLEHVEPGVEGAEEEAHDGEVEVGVGEGDLGHVELKAAPVGEPELVKGDDGAVVVSDLGEADLREGGGREEEREGEEEGQGEQR